MIATGEASGKRLGTALVIGGTVVAVLTVLLLLRENGAVRIATEPASSFAADLELERTLRSMRFRMEELRRENEDLRSSVANGIPSTTSMAPARAGNSTGQHAQSFVILMPEGRVGSTWLVTLLAQCPTVHVRGEILGTGSDTEARMWDRAQKMFFQVMANKPAGNAVGFKTRISIFYKRNRQFHDVVMSSRPKVIFMNRRNSIKRILSGWRGKMLADACGSWNLDPSLQAKNCTIPSTMTVEVEKLDGALRGIDKNNYLGWRYVRHLSLFLPVLEVFYEDLDQNPEYELQRMVSFLGVECDVSSISRDAKTVKNTKSALRDVIINYDELVEHFNNTPVADMLDEGRDIWLRRQYPELDESTFAKLPEIVEDRYTPPAWFHEPLYRQPGQPWSVQSLGYSWPDERTVSSNLTARTNSSSS